MKLQDLIKVFSILNQVHIKFWAKQVIAKKILKMNSQQAPDLAKI